MPNRVLNKIRYAAKPTLRMVPDKQLNRLKHLRRQLDGSIGLIQVKANYNQFMFTQLL